MFGDVPLWIFVVIGLAQMLIMFFGFGFVCRKVARSMVGHANYDRLTSDLTGKTHARNRIDELTGVLCFTEQASLELRNKLRRSSLVDRAFKFRGRLLGAADLEIDGFSITVFEWQMTGKQNACISTQTALVLTPQSIHKIPEFYLRPSADLFGINVHLTRYERVTEIPWSDYIVESPAMGYQVRQLFEADCDVNGSQLITSIRGGGWTVEWTGQHFVAYRFDTCVPAAQISAFVAETVELFGRVTETAEITSSYLDRKLVAAADAHALN